VSFILCCTIGRSIKHPQDGRSKPRSSTILPVSFPHIHNPTDYPDPPNITARHILLSPLNPLEHPSHSPKYSYSPCPRRYRSFPTNYISCPLPLISQVQHPFHRLPRYPSTTFPHPKPQDQAPWAHYPISRFRRLVAMGNSSTNKGFMAMLGSTTDLSMGYKLDSGDLDSAEPA
jgi:hypothetical protein